MSACGAAGAAASEQALDWSIHAAKDAYYPGEPVALTVTVNNRGPQQKVVCFEDDLEVASVEIRNLSGEVLTKGRTVKTMWQFPRPYHV